MNMEISFPGGQKVDASYNGFTVHTDQPSEAGGNDTAPSPFDLFWASLGTCAGYYVLQFCRDRGIPTEEIELNLRTHKNQEKKLVDRVQIEIKLPPAFPDKYRKAIIKAAETCTVKKHLQTPPVIETVLSD